MKHWKANKHPRYRLDTWFRIGNYTHAKYIRFGIGAIGVERFDEKAAWHVKFNLIPRPWYKTGETLFII